MYVLLHNRQKSITKKYYKNVLQKSITKKYYTLAAFSISPLVRTHSKNEVTQKEGRDRGSNKSVTRFRNFMEVPTKF